MNFLTPDSSEFLEPEECRTISLPPALWPLVNGALERLTAVYNWDAQGDATPDESAQFFTDVIDAYNASSGQCGMKFINSAQVTLFNETYVWFSGYSIPITHASLPSEASSATGLLCNFICTIPYYGINLDTRDLSSKAYQYLRLPNSGANRLSIILPMTNGGCRLSMAAATGDSITWALNLVGWW